MPGYAAMLRAVNVSGTGKLPMAELKRMGEACGFAGVRTYIASGNLLFWSDRSEGEVQAAIADQVERWFGRAFAVLVRTAAELREVLSDNPFPDEKGSRLLVSFLQDPPPAGTLESVRGQQRERIALGRREVYIAYGDGIGTSKLVIPSLVGGTARNINTVAKLAELAPAAP